MYIHFIVWYFLIKYIYLGYEIVLIISIIRDTRTTKIKIIHEVVIGK